MRTAALTDSDVEFLTRPLHGFLTVAGDSPQPPQPRPIWFEVTADREIAFFTLPDAPKLRRLQRDPRASLVVAAPVGERERWVSVTGRATVEPDGAHDLVARLGARYWDLDDPDRGRGHADDLAAMQAADPVRVVLHPEDVRSVRP